MILTFIFIVSIAPMEICYFIIVCLLLFRCVLQGEKYSYVTIFFTIFMSYLFAFNTQNNDYEAYLSFYNSLGSGNLTYITNNSESSPLFSYSALFFKKLGFDFNGYRLAMFVIIACMFGWRFRDRANFGVFISMFALIIFFFDLVQIRFAFSEFLVLLGLADLVQNKRIQFVIWIVIASLFHNMNLVFLLFIFIPSIENHLPIIEKYFPFIYPLLLIGSVMAEPLILLQQAVSSMSMFDEYSRYVEREVRYGYLIYIGYQFMNIMLAKTTYNKFTIDLIRYPFQYKMNKLNYLIQLVGILFVIPTMLNVNFSRYLRELYLMNAINLSCVLYAIDINSVEKNDRRYYSLVAMAVIAVWLIGELYANGSYTTIRQYIFG